MKRLNEIRKSSAIIIIMMVIFSTTLAGCGKRADDSLEGQSIMEDISDQNGNTSETEGSGESTDEKTIDFAELQKDMPNVFAWITIPGTDVDAPILQNADEADDYYQSHDEHGNPSDTGAAYTEYPNRTDFCEFNEVIYGVDKNTVLSYKNPEFFEANRFIDIYIEGNHLTYEVVLARDWNREDLLEEYAYPVTSECQRFLDELKENMSLTDNESKGFKNVNFTSYIITLVAYEEDKPDQQYMVIARLIEDRNHTIHEPESEIPGIEGDF